METLVYQVNPRDLELVSPYKDLFPLDSAKVEAIAESMRSEGYLKVYPIACWNGVVIDGHTRVAAAKKAGLRQVETVWMDFDDEDAALDFAIRAQRNRRNLTESDILRCIETLDKRQSHGGDRRSEFKAPEGALKGGRDSGATALPGERLHGDEHRPAPQPKVKSARKTAELLGISPRQVERARTILDHGSEEVKQAVAKGEKTISGAYNEVQEARKPKPEAKPEPVAVHPVEPAPALDFEIGLMKTFRASSEQAAREQFLIWCRNAPEKEILAAVVCEKAS